MRSYVLSSGFAILGLATTPTASHTQISVVGSTHAELTSAPGSAYECTIILRNLQHSLG